MNVSIAIMAHPDREPWVDELRATLGDVPVAWAEPPFYEGGEDRSAAWRTRRAALLLHTDAPFHCVIQDDAILGADFRERLEALVEAGDYLYGLFYRRKHERRDDAPMTQHRHHDLALRAVRGHKDHFITSGYILGVGMALSTDRIADLVAYGDAKNHTRGDDYRMKWWAKERGIESYVPIPSLVNHRIGPSLVGHSGDRQAWKFA